MTSSGFDDEMINELASIVGTEGLRTSREDTEPFDTDWTRLKGCAELVVLPRNTAEVSEVIRFCNEAKVKVVPSGGRTGLAGGAVVSRGQLALNLGRMKKIYEVDSIGRTMRVQAGAIVEAIHETAHAAGFIYPIDLASKGSATIGGNISTNAGGVRVIRYGMTRKWVNALQAVLPSGEVLEINRGLEKNNSGYDLLQLLIGSEGTLAVITEATLKLAPRPTESVVFFFSLSSLEQMNRLLTESWKAPFRLNAFEFLSESCFELVRKTLRRGESLLGGKPYFALLDVEPSVPGNSDLILAWLEKILTAHVVADGEVAFSPEQAKELWAVREGITESIAQRGAVIKYDVAIPVKRTAEFLDAAVALHEQKPRLFDLFLFGHFGDGSPHLNLSQKHGVEKHDFLTSVSDFQTQLYPLIKSFDGSASSEHGIGLNKKDWLTFSRTPTEIALFRAVKKAFDPNHIMNPGKIFD